VGWWRKFIRTRMRAKMTMQIVDFRGMKYTLAKMIKTYHEKKVEEKKHPEKREGYTSRGLERRPSEGIQTVGNDSGT